MSDKDHCNAAFEQWALQYLPAINLAKNEKGHYFSGDAFVVWSSWQTAWSHPSAELAASREREARLIQVLAMANDAMNHMGDVLNGHDMAEPEDVEKVTPAFDAVRAALSQSSAPASEPADPIETLTAELTADVPEYPEPPQLDPAHNALLYASSWIAHVPHGDNCFLMNEGEYNRCYCGRDALLEAINDALIIVEAEKDEDAAPKEPNHD